jgi:hypothetical protein
MVFRTSLGFRRQAGPLPSMRCSRGSPPRPCRVSSPDRRCRVARRTRDCLFQALGIAAEPVEMVRRAAGHRAGGRAGRISALNPGGPRGIQGLRGPSAMHPGVFADAAAERKVISQRRGFRAHPRQPAGQGFKTCSPSGRGESTPDQRARLDALSGPGRSGGERQHLLGNPVVRCEARRASSWRAFWAPHRGRAGRRGRGRPRVKAGLMTQRSGSRKHQIQLLLLPAPEVSHAGHAQLLAKQAAADGRHEWVKRRRLDHAGAEPVGQRDAAIAPGLHKTRRARAESGSPAPVGRTSRSSTWRTSTSTRCSPSSVFR